MKVVALLSGGKDSVFNLLHCIANDHEPIALASLGPPLGQDEMDSYMYQTVGHSGLSCIAEALGLPLLTETIRGKAINVGGEYGSREALVLGSEAEAEDETEDLFRLLKGVKDKLPQIQGVACGAILSNYQRVRVEHVCSRLGLTPIAYLWERSQPELLREMVLAGMNSVLVKVAGAGLGVQHLGKSLAQMEPILYRLNEKYQLHVCGEGGEYETFTVDCPLFHKKIILDKTTTIVSNGDSFSTVAHLHLDNCTFEPKPGYPLTETWEEKRERIRSLLGPAVVLDKSSQDVKETVKREYTCEALEKLPVELQEIACLSLKGIEIHPTVLRRGEWVTVAEVTGFADGLFREDVSLNEEVHACFSRLKDLLAEHSATLLHLSHLTLYLSPAAMALFPAINKIYSTYFGSSPPTRACVSVVSNYRIKLEGVARVSPSSERKALHVQSLSYWAAANIGPYSQAVIAGDKLFVAGQIPLIPASLTLKRPLDYPFEISLSRQHLSRIVERVDEGRWNGTGDGGICWVAEVEGDDGREWNRRVHAAKTGAHEDWGPIVYVSATKLPRDASVEWQISFRRTPQGADSDDDEQPNPTEKHPPSGSKIITFKSYEHVDPASVILVRAFQRPGFTLDQVATFAQKVFGAAALPTISTVCCKHIATAAETNLDVALQLLYL
ncbi:hypothetical protein T439DRAFT_325947 [Meredithblackwellia eburnea MCA 4105]